MRQRIAEWRGQPPPTPVERPGAVVSADVSVSKEAAATLPAEATVFVIARDPNAPSPPIAVIRRRLSELPTTVELRDQDSMIPGRSLSGFAEFELVARVSVSGEPVARSGDWFASAIVNPSESRDVNLAIQEQVP
jgi:cytochrome c-type biogenesis protein CcmH